MNEPKRSVILLAFMFSLISTDAIPQNESGRETGPWSKHERSDGETRPSEIKESYLKDDTQFLLIKNTNRQGEAWAICSASYKIFSELIPGSPTQTKQMIDLGNGASTAVIMTHVMNGLKRDMNQKSFTALWNYSKTLGITITETQLTMILADAEFLGDEGKVKFLGKLANTLEICTHNLQTQQMYIDSWREIAKSGLLILPDE